MSAPRPELLAALNRAALARSGRRQGREIRFLCPAHDDHRPSARWHREKGVWRCDACGGGGGAVDLAQRLGVELPALPARTLLETVYVVRDVGGLPIAEHVRQDLTGGGKRFFWRRDGRPGLRGLRSSELPLYGAERAGEWDTARPVFVTEGEKAAACLAGIGAQTVGTVTGASGTPGAGPL
ncbi:MAG TPA: CHC2 zinc finger domain-containing protein, partial [Thermoanaerobaculia bacterium]